MFTIEKNIPIPKIKNKVSPFVEIVSSLKIGDSFLVDKFSQVSSVYIMAKKL